MKCKVDKNLLKEITGMLKQYSSLIEIYWREENLSRDEADRAIKAARELQEITGDN